MNRQRFGKNIQDLICSLDLSVDAFTLRIGVDRRSGYRWIHGYQTPSLEMLVRIRDEFGVSIDKLLEGV